MHPTRTTSPTAAIFDTLLEVVCTVSTSATSGPITATWKLRHGAYAGGAVQTASCSGGGRQMYTARGAPASAKKLAQHGHSSELFREKVRNKRKNTEFEVF